MINLIYEDIPPYDLWLKLVLGGTLALTSVIGVILIFEDIWGALVMFAVTLFDFVLFWAILPRKYQVLQDGLRIVLGGPFAFNIPFSTTKEIRAVTGSNAFVYGGLRFATSSKTVVEVVRNKGMNVVISPANREMFVEQASRALEVSGN